MSKAKRQMGNPRPLWAFRPTAELEDHILALPGERTANIVAMLELAAGVRRELGDNWWEVVKRAGVQKTSEGVVIAGLVKDALK